MAMEGGREEKTVRVLRWCYVAWAAANVLAMVGSLVYYFKAAAAAPPSVAPELVVYCCVLLDLIVVDCCQLIDRTNKEMSKFVVWGLIALNTSALAGDLVCFILASALRQDHHATVAFTGEVTFYCCVLLNLVPLIYSEKMGGAMSKSIAWTMIAVDVATVVGCLVCYLVDMIWLRPPHRGLKSSTVELVVRQLMPSCLVVNVLFLLSSKMYEYCQRRRRLCLVHHHPNV